MPTKRRAIRRKRTAAPRVDVVPVTRDDVSDLAVLPQAFRMFVATYEADHDWLKEKITAILTRLDSMERRADLHEQRLGSLDRRVDDHEKRIERLEEAKKGTEP
jgi:hypothetical protein